MYKVQLTLTPEENQLLSIRAQQLGYNVTKYIKLLISKEAQSLVEDYPAIKLSKKAIKTIDKAMKEHVSGKSVLLENIDDLDML